MKCCVVALVLLLTSVSACDAQVRRWTDVTGKYSVEAELVDFKDGRVHLRKADGQVVAVPLEKLSAADQEHVRQAARQPAAGQEKPREPARTAKPAAPKPVWTMSLARMRIPESAASGKIHGKDFLVASAEFQNGVLTLRQGEDTFPDLALTIFLFLKEGETVEGKKFRVTPKDGFGSPHVHVKWREKKGEGMPKSETFMKEYAMVLELGKKQRGKIPGKIYACMPDESRSFVAGTFTIVLQDETSEPGAGEIGGKITVQGPRPQGWITVGCLGKSPEGKIESPAAGTKTDASRGGGTCLTWKPRNTTLRWDGKNGSGTHQHVNRPPGRYLVYLQGGRSDPSSSAMHYEGYYDWKWVDVRDDGSAVAVDLQIEPASLGTLEVIVTGSTKESSVVYLPLDDEGQLPHPGAHYYSSRSSSAEIKDGKAVIRGLREGKYQVAMGPWQRGARSPDSKTVLEMLPSVTADIEVKRGTTVRVQLTPEEPNAASTPKIGMKTQTPAGSGERSGKESVAGTINLMATAKYSSSSEHAGTDFVTAKAFDGEYSTRWESQSGGAHGVWLAARWAQPVTIRKLTIREAHDRITDSVIQRFDDTKNGWVDLLHVFGNRHLSSYSRKGGERGWGYLPDAVWVDDRRLGDSKDRTFGVDPDGSVHPVFTINLPDPLTTTGVRMFVKRSTGKSVSIFEMEAY